MIQFLPFDSSLFGYRVGKLLLEKSLPDMERIQSAACGYRLVYVMGKPGLVKLGGWPPISTRVDLVKAILKSDLEIDSENTGNVEVVEQDLSASLSDADQQQLRELVFTSGQCSRFRQDPLLANKEYEKLYSTWWETITRQKHRVIVARKDGRLLGFITFRLLRGRGYVDLFAVERNSQGKGIGRLLMRKVFREVYASGLVQVGLSTQKANKRAMTFYRKAGFQPMKETLIAHWRPDVPH
jgi:GNAT superfamily N-acetyltransferase